MILYIAIGVVGIVFVLWLIGVLRDGRNERHRVREFQQDIAMQERARYEKEEWLRPYPSAPDDDTATWSILPKD